MRYLVFQFMWEKPSKEKAKLLLETVLKEQLGKILMAKEGIRFMEKQYDEKMGTGLIKGEDAEKIRAALLFSDSAINIKGISGTINGTKRFR